MSAQADALKRVALDDPELAARLILMTLPATGRDVSYTLEVEGLGEHRVATANPSSA